MSISLASSSQKSKDEKESAHDKNLLSLVIKDYEYFLRCEHYSRFSGTTVFEMNDFKYWDTYFKSTASGGQCDRFAATFKREKIFNNPLLCYDGVLLAAPNNAQKISPIDF